MDHAVPAVLIDFNIRCSPDMSLPRRRKWLFFVEHLESRIRLNTEIPLPVMYMLLLCKYGSVVKVGLPIVTLLT